MEVQEIKEQLKEIFRTVINNNKVENWNEQDHPRDKQGKFTEKDGENKKQDLEYNPMRKWAMKFETEKLERQRKRDELSGKLTREAQRKDFDSFYNEYGDLFDTKDDVRKFHTLKQQEYNGNLKSWCV